MTEIKLYDVVALLEDMSEQHLERGDVGTVVEYFAPNEKRPEAFLVEFSDENGVTFALAPLQSNQFIRLRYRKAA